MIWNAANTKVSGSIDCEIKQIDYITLKGNGSCMFGLVAGETGTDTSVCALPKDIHCSGTLQDFPIVKAIVEGIK
jgi:hypothetical protein